MLHGSVYVWDSLLNLMKTDSELAVVLAHELAHVACAHTLETASVHYAERAGLVPPVTAAVQAATQLTAAPEEQL
jgi:Zn-dependent protease with chaperone function